MNTYEYFKSGMSIKEVPFIEMIRFDKDLYSKIDHIGIKYREETELFDHIVFLTPNPLDQVDEQKIIDMVQDWSEMNPFCAQYNMRQGYQDERLKKGRDITSRIAVMNQYNDKDLAVLFTIYVEDLGLLNMIDSGAFEMAFILIRKMVKAIDDGTPNPRWEKEELDTASVWIEWEIGETMAVNLQAMVDGGLV